MFTAFATKHYSVTLNGLTAVAVVVCSMSCTQALVWWVGRCVRACVQGGGVSIWEAFSISDSLQNRYPHPPQGCLCQSREKPRMISSTSARGLHCSLYLALSVLLMNEAFCDSQSQYARGMLSYHQVMNKCQELFFWALRFWHLVYWKDGVSCQLPLSLHRKSYTW